MTGISNETAAKAARLRKLSAAHGLDGILLATISNFAWLTGGGDSHVTFVSDRGVAALLVDEAGVHLITSNIEAARVVEEQLPGLTPDSTRVFNWYESSLPATLNAVVEEATRGGRRLGADFAAPDLVDLSGEILACHRPFLPEETARLRGLARDVASVFEAAADRIQPGMTEWQVAGVLCDEVLARGAQAPGVFVGADERVFLRRHPVMVGRTIERYVLMGLVVQRGGLHVALSRSIHFGPAPADLVRRQAAAASVEATLLGASRPGALLSEALAAAQATYALEGFPDEWRHLHLGGVIGYLPREYVANPTSEVRLLAEQGVAWSPTVTGAKCEETALVTADGAEVLTQTPSWPVSKLSSGGREFPIAGILCR